MSKRFLIVLVAALAVSGAAWAGGAAEGEEGHDDEAHEEGIPHIDAIDLADGEKLQLVGSFNILGDVLRQVVGDAADVVVLIETGQNPHSYEPTPRALRHVERAHMVFVNGLGLEENLLDDVEATAGGYVVPVSVGIDTHDFDDGDHDDDDHAEGDPHVWMDPNNVVQWVDNMVEVLSEADRANAAVYRANGDAYVSQLESIDLFIREQVRSIPRSARRLIVDHESFSYFADEYGFEIIGAIVPGTTDTAEPSAQAIAALVELIREEGVYTIFVGRTASRSLSELARTIAAEVGRPVEIVPTLTGSLAPEGEPGDTYLGLLRYNVEQIMNGLAD